MKTLVLACAAWLLGVGGVRADLTVVQKVEGLGQDMENTAKFKAGKIRVDTSPGTSILMDLQSGETINLMHAPKTYLKVSGAMTPAAVKSMKQKSAGETELAAPPVLIATGKKDTISGFAAEEYLCPVGKLKVLLWLTRALPGYETALKEMNGAFSEGPLEPLTHGGENVDLTILPGFPVRTVVEISPGQTVTRTVVSVNTQPIADAEFEIPAGYQEISVPVLTPPAAAVQPSPVASR